MRVESSMDVRTALGSRLSAFGVTAIRARDEISLRLRHDEITRASGDTQRSYLMKYPDTLQTPSLSSMGVIVSMADCLCSKLVSYWSTTYSPSGAPGSDLV